MNVVILQPSYIPWRGFFHQIARADIFVFYDDVKYDKNGWRNRNRIKTPNGLQWLTIPVLSKGVETHHTPINQIAIDWKTNWNRKHWNALLTSYKRAPFFDQYEQLLTSFYQKQPTILADFTIETTIGIARELGLKNTQFIRSSEIKGIVGAKTDRLMMILDTLKATHYISGPSAQDYLDKDAFKKAGITLEFMQYNYPEYNQLYPPYEPQVSILDLLFMQGNNSLKFITG